MHTKRGRPEKEYSDKKRLVTCVKLVPEDAITLDELARKSGISVYKYVERIIKDRLDEYRDQYDYDDEPYDYPEDVDEDDDEKVQFEYFM
jgi:hypothetical protein